MRKTIAALIAAGVVLGSAASASATPTHVLASQSATGAFSAAAVSITVTKPRPIYLVVTGTAPVKAFWSVGCATPTFHINSHGGNFDGPATKVVAYSAGAADCVVVLSATSTNLTASAPKASVKIEQ